MALAPVCNRCSKPHFNFVACDKAGDWNARQKPLEPTMSSTMRTVPGGFHEGSGWGARPDGWGPAPEDFHPGWGPAPEGYHVLGDRGPQEAA